MTIETKPYYVNTSTFGWVELTPAYEPKPLTIEGFEQEFVSHRTLAFNDAPLPSKEYWTVSEAHSGYAVVNYALTRAKAITEAKDRLVNKAGGAKSFEEYIKEAIDKRGLSPRYKSESNDGLNKAGQC